MANVNVKVRSWTKEGKIGGDERVKSWLRRHTEKCKKVPP